MHYISIISVIILFCFFLTNDAADLTPAVCKDLAKADKMNVNYNYCVSKLELNPQSSQATAPELGVISFQLAMIKSKDVLKSINTALKLSPTNPHEKRWLRRCSIIYSRIPSQLNAGVLALKSGEYKAANAKVGAVLKGARICRHVIKHKYAGLLHVTKTSADFCKLGAISLGFTDLLRILN